MPGQEHVEVQEALMSSVPPMPFGGGLCVLPTPVSLFKPAPQSGPVGYLLLVVSRRYLLILRAQDLYHKTNKSHCLTHFYCS